MTGIVHHDWRTNSQGQWYIPLDFDMAYIVEETNPVEGWEVNLHRYDRTGGVIHEIWIGTASDEHLAKGLAELDYEFRQELP